jgi:hypothetical protein
MSRNMDHDIPYSRCYALDSDDDGSEEEVDEEGFTANEAEFHEKVLLGILLMWAVRRWPYEAFSGGPNRCKSPSTFRVMTKGHFGHCT